MFGKKFEKLNLSYAYNLASVITNIILNNNIEEYIWFFNMDSDEYYKELLEENTLQVFNPSKETLLHFFIRDIFNMALMHDIYWFKDDFYNWDYDSLELYIQGRFVSILESYDVKAPKFPSVIEKIYDDWENEKITESDYNKKICNYSVAL